MSPAAGREELRSPATGPDCCTCYCSGSEHFVAEHGISPRKSVGGKKEGVLIVKDRQGHRGQQLHDAVKSTLKMTDPGPQMAFFQEAVKCLMMTAF